MNAVAVMCIHGRDALTSAVLKHYKAIGLPVVAAVSQRDKGKHTDLLEVEFAHKNQPLGAKKNAALKACRDLDPDVVFDIPSDDLFCRRYIARALQMAENADLVHTRSLYIYGALERLLLYFPRIFVGAGRVYSRRLLDLADWQLWTDTQQFGLDGDSLSQIKRATGGSYDAVQMGDLREQGLMGVDIKTSENIHGFDKLSARKDWQLVAADETPGLLMDAFPAVFEPARSVKPSFQVEHNRNSGFASAIL